MTHRLSCSKGSRNAFRRRRRGRRGGLRPHGATSLAHEGTRRSPASASLPPSKSLSAGRNRPSNILCDIVPVERWPLKNFDLQKGQKRIKRIPRRRKLNKLECRVFSFPFSKFRFHFFLDHSENNLHFTIFLITMRYCIMFRLEIFINFLR